jgi:transcriptional regulator of NAD metabolism
MTKLLPGEVITTTEFKETLNVGDVVAVGDGGTLEAIGARTPKQSYTVIEKPTLWGVTCVKCIVNE